MRHVGFSTGAIARADFRAALEQLRLRRTSAIELSALREAELEPLISALPSLDLRRYQYVSLHAPSSVRDGSERALVNQLMAVAQRKWPIIVHADVIVTPRVWRPLGEFLCIENMDLRKPQGRSCDDLERLGASLPEATFCIDLGHARQVDPSMTEAYAMLTRLRPRIRQFHLSDVSASSTHHELSVAAMLAFSSVLPHVDEETPVILEAPAQGRAIDRELARAHHLLSHRRHQTASALVERAFPSPTTNAGDRPHRPS